jgi:hypothetical protein
MNYPSKDLNLQYFEPQTNSYRLGTRGRAVLRYFNFVIKIGGIHNQVSERSKIKVRSLGYVCHPKDFFVTSHTIGISA